MSSGAAASMWAEFQAETGVEEGYEAWSFGSERNPEMATELALLVRDGPKRATAGVHDDYLGEGHELPKPGDYSVILDGSGNPICIIKTTEVTVKPFGQVDESFAWDEGEGDRTLAWWRDAHRRFFESEGIDIDDTTRMILERFDLVWPT